MSSHAIHRWTLVALAATIGLVPVAGALAHSHEHHDAAAGETHASAALDGPAVAAPHDAEDHGHHPISDAVVSRPAGIWSAPPPEVPLLAIAVLEQAVAPIGEAADPPPRPSRPPPRSPRAPPLG